MRPTKRCLTMMALAALALWIKATANGQEKAPQSSLLNSPLLVAADKAVLTEVLRLQATLGDQVWPGLGQARILLILYNDAYEFLVGASQPPAPWVTVEGDDYQGRPYHRRPASDPQAFAVAVGGQWAGCFCTLEMLNRSFPVRLGRDFQAIAFLHEMFHAFQATQAAARFTAALAVYKFEKRYPQNDVSFAAAWTREGSLLARALKATDDAETRRTVQQFLQTRQARRAQAALAPELVSYERELEWLEGLAKYTETRFYELAAARASDPAYADYKPGLPYWQPDFWRLENLLGQQGGDLRFYLSGMAQARLLDRLSPGWNAQALRAGVHLEDMLRSAVGSEVK